MLHETVDTCVCLSNIILWERLERMLAQYLILLVRPDASRNRRLALMITLLRSPCCGDQDVGLEQPNDFDIYVTYSLARVS